MKKTGSFPSRKAIVIGAAWLFIGFFIILSNRAMPNVDLQALKFYSEGSYRHSIEVLSGKLFLSGLDTYLMARNYQELNQWEKALSWFRRVRVNDLEGDRMRHFFVDNYAYYYSLAIYTGIVNKGTNTEMPELSVLSNIWSKVETNSFAYDAVTGTFCYFQWMNSNYGLLTNEQLFPRTNAATRLFRAAAGFILGDRARFPEMFDNRGGKYLPLIMKDLSNIVENQDFMSFDKNQLANAVQYYLDAGNISNSENLLKMHYTLTGDRDFYVRQRAQALFRAGKRQEAVSVLQSYYYGGKAGESVLAQLTGYLMRTENYGAVYTLLKSAVKAHPSFIDELILAMGKLGRYEELYQWYRQNSGMKMFQSEYGQTVFNILLQNGEGLARKLAQEEAAKGRNYFFTYARGLFELKDGRTNDAYRSLLTVTLNYPFTYEWVIAKRYEKQFRTNFSAIYGEALSNIAGSEKKLSVQDKLNYYLMLDEVEPAMFSNYSTNGEYLAALSNVRTALSNAFTNISKDYSEKLDWARNQATDWLGDFNQELLNFIDRSPDDSNDRYKMVYTCRDWLEKIGAEGTVVYRMNYYLTKVLGGRKYHALLEDDLLRDLYPVNEMRVIGQTAPDTNTGLWLLSAFREESHFMKDALSSSGAVGLSQLMPKTADTIKKNIKKENFDIHDYRDNIAIGVYHFIYLFRKYRDNAIYSLAAYNAGETAVNRWIKRYNQTPELWVESLDYEETRNYVKKIVLTRYYYDRIYNYPEAGPLDGRSETDQ